MIDPDKKTLFLEVLSKTGFSERGGISKRNLCFFIWNPEDLKDD